MRRKKRILLLTPFFAPNLGGVETHLNGLCAYLTKKNFPVTVLTYQPLTTPARGLSYEKKGSLQIHRISWFSGNIFSRLEKAPPIFNFLYLTPRLFIETILFLLRHHKKIDVIHAYGLNASFIARILKLIFGKKRIVMSTEALYYYQPTGFFTTVVRWVLSGFDKILAQSEESKIEMVKIGIKKENIEVFCHWVNQDIFKPKNKLRSKKKIGWEDRFTVLYLCRLIPEKGIGLFIKAAEKLPNINFKAIGDDGPELSKVIMAEKNLKNFKYLGPIPHHELASYYAGADVLLYPALYKEDMSYSLLESLSCGTPVINTNEGSGIYRLDKKVAFVIKPKVEEIRRKILYLYNHSDVWLNMVNLSPKFARRFGPKMAKVIIDAY